MAFAADVDSNSPAVWELVDGQPTLFVVNSFDGAPQVTSGRSLDDIAAVAPLQWVGAAPSGGVWMESVLADDGGAWYGYYHLEAPDPSCPGSSKMVPRIGAARSYDFGASWEDLGIVLEQSIGGLSCATNNFYFLGGVGDFSAVLDASHQFVYLLYTQYLEPSAVGVAVARMSWAARDEPVGAIDVWQQGTWQPSTWVSFTERDDEEGSDAGLWLYPTATPVYPAANSWDDDAAGTDVFWGPSVHWNSFLQSWVMLLNRADDNEWHQGGIYVSFNASIDRPDDWSPPAKLLDGGQWYPQVLGLERGEGTDKEAGQFARFFMNGRSEYLVRFAPR